MNINEQILAYIKSINEMLNSWIANAKKAEELPVMETMNPNGLLIVSELEDGIYKSKQLEIQKIIDGISLDGQNNTVREFLLGTITEFHDLAYLLDNNGLTVSENEIIIITALTIIDSTYVQKQYIWKKGKGEFNPIGSTDINSKLLELQPRFINEIISEELTSSPQSIVYDFGVITDPILDVLNNASPARNYTDEEKIYYIRATKDGVNLLYNFIGINGIYGEGEPQMTNEDLVLVYSSANADSTNILDTKLDKGGYQGTAVDFVEKNESQDVIVGGITAVLDQVDLLDNRSSLSITGAITDIKSIQLSPVYIRPGKPFFIKNRTAHNVKLWHDAGTGNIPFFFADAQDLVVKPGEVIPFNLNADDSSDNRLELVGNKVDLGNQISSAPEKLTIHDNDKVGTADSEDANKSKYWKFSTIKTVLKTYFDSVDQTYSGVKTFLAGKFGLRNTANTFTSYFANAVTASRTWTWPDKSGTVAMTSDIVNQLSGSINYIVKFGTNTSGISSRLFDNGIVFGIGTYRTPTKDITVGNQGNREIGIEESDNTTVGRDLVVCAGRTINYVPDINFNPLNQVTRGWYGIACHVNLNVYVATVNGDIYMQTGGTGNFVALSQTSRSWYSISCHSNGNVYATVNGGDIYMQTGGTGNFVALSQTVRAWGGISCHSNGNVYATVNGGDIYMQTGGTGNFVALSQTSRVWQGISCHSNGNVYATVNGGDIYMQQNNGTGSSNLKGGTLKLKAGTGKGNAQSRIEFITGHKTVSGTDMQIETTRGYFDELGNFICLYIPIYANDAAADADTNLPSGGFYKITGNRTTFQKP